MEKFSLSERPGAQVRPDHEALFQIIVDENHPVHGRREMAVGPKMCRKFLEPIMELIGTRIANGTERDSRQPWSNPRLVQVTAPIIDSPFTHEDRQNDLVRDHRYHPDAIHAAPALIH